MLTSERKLQKLFIKFIEWGKVAKAANLTLSHPELEIPWQKAFEKAALNNEERGARWIYERVSTSTLGIKIDIHFENDKLLNYLTLQDYQYFIKWIIALEPTYPWLSTITNETLARARKDTLSMLS